MSRYALLCGSAPSGQIQKKVDEMYDFLLSPEGGEWDSDELMIFPNGISSEILADGLNRLRMGGVDQIFLYICTVSPVADDEKSVWLGGNEVPKSIFEKSASLTEFVVGKGNVSVQVVYACDREFVSGEEYFLV